VGKLQERTAWWFHSKYDALSEDDGVIAEYRQSGWFFITFHLTIKEPEPEIDRRLLIAAGLLLTQGRNKIGVF